MLWCVFSKKICFLEKRVFFNPQYPRVARFATWQAREAAETPLPTIMSGRFPPTCIHNSYIYTKHRLMPTSVFIERCVYPYVLCLGKYEIKLYFMNRKKNHSIVGSKKKQENRALHM
jgi:hypothetical protein